MSTAATPDSEPLGYEGELLALVRETAPRMFAVVAEYAAGTDDADAVVIAWGHAHEGGRTEVIGPRGRRWTLASPDSVTRLLPGDDACATRLVWLPRAARG
ncbi:hypothetical protein AB0910_30640 [Streptomyces sp. NPDC047002]|uniref:hypothetical protein n=1 Tax=Streptomyces sp. NPDC047002 TaxID=3155475 RepID=UPI00345252F7